MKAKRTGTFVVALLAMITVAGVSPALTQEKPADNMQIVRDKLRADKKLLVAANMQLTESEAKDFWPVYDSHQKELGLLRDRMLSVIKEYAANHETLLNDTAKKLLEDYLAIERDHQKLREAYLPKFRKVLSEKKVARYYQIENKIDAVVNYQLGAEIPLVE